MALSKKKVTELAWKRGQLSYKVRPHQRTLYENLWANILEPSKRKFVINCSRRFGKSFITMLTAFEYALRNPGSQIRFYAPYYQQLKNTLFPIIKLILTDAPGTCRPKLLTNSKMVRFPNGAEIHLAGVNDGSAESLRGSMAHITIVDEAGSVNDLRYLVRSVINPLMLTTRGTLLLVSTPSLTPDHDYKAFAEEAEQDGSYAKYTIHDNSSLTPEDIAEAIRDSGGAESTDFKREYLCEWVVDQTRQIIHEWKEEFIGEDDPGAIHYNRWHRYTALDLGVRDLTAGLYAHYNFANATLYIDDESTMNGSEMTTQLLAEQIRLSEKGVARKLRIADNNNLLLLNDLGGLHSLPFMPVHKGSLEQMINSVRLLVGAGRLRVAPRCKMLIGCLRNAIWNERHKDFARSEAFGHYDHLAALMYLVVSLDTYTNPIPNDYGYDAYSQINRPAGHQNATNATVRSIFSKRTV